MAKERIDVLELLRKRGMDGDLDFLREALRVLVDGIDGRRGLGPDRRRLRRTDSGPGNPPQRVPDTYLGHWGRHHGPAHPQDSGGHYFPTLLEPRRRSERALPTVIQQAYVEVRFHPARG